jgi:hypothetical protein
VAFRLTFPTIVNEFLSALSFFELLPIFQFAFVPNCLYSLDYYDQLTVKVLGPTAILFVAYFGYRSDTRQRWMYEIFLLFSFLCYPSFCDSLFRFFDCREYEDNESYLVMYPDVKCTEEKYNLYYYPVMAMGFVLPFGIIAFYARELVNNKKTLWPKEVSNTKDVSQYELEHIPRSCIGGCNSATVEHTPRLSIGAGDSLSEDAAAAAVAVAAAAAAATATTTAATTTAAAAAASATTSGDAKEPPSFCFKFICSIWAVESTTSAAEPSNKAPSRSQSLCKVLRKVFVDLTTTEEVGITEAELEAAFAAKEAEGGIDLAVEWLQICVRDARAMPAVPAVSAVPAVPAMPDNDGKTENGAHHLMFLYASYKPKYYWFEAFEMLRKFLLTGLPLLTRIFFDSNTEPVWGTLLTVIFAAYVNSVEPYIDENDQQLSTFAHFHVGAVMIAGMGNDAMTKNMQSVESVAAATSEMSDGSEIFVAVVVMGPASILLVILLYGIFDPDYKTYFARTCVALFTKLSLQASCNSVHTSGTDNGAPNGARSNTVHPAAPSSLFRDEDTVVMPRESAGSRISKPSNAGNY